MNNLFAVNTPLAIDIEFATINNPNYRQVLYTGKFQVVVMSLLPGEEIGYEFHSDRDQFIRVESGSGIGVITNTQFKLENGSTLVVPAGYGHNVINTGNEDLKLYTIYSTPEHPFNRLQVNKPSESE